MITTTPRSSLSRLSVGVSQFQRSYSNQSSPVSQRTPINTKRHDKNIQHDSLLRRAVLNSLMAEGDNDIEIAPVDRTRPCSAPTESINMLRHAAFGPTSTLVPIKKSGPASSRESSMRSVDSGVSSLTSASSTRSVIQLNHSSALTGWSLEQLDDFRSRLNDPSLVDLPAERDRDDQDCIRRSECLPPKESGKKTSSKHAITWFFFTPRFGSSFSRTSGVTTEQRSVSVDSNTVKKKKAGRFSGISSFFRRRTLLPITPSSTRDHGEGTNKHKTYTDNSNNKMDNESSSGQERTERVKQGVRFPFLKRHSI